MKKKQILAALAVASFTSIASADGIIYDGFNYDATGTPFLGTAKSTVGTTGNWYYQGNGAVEPRVTAGSLSYTGMPASTANSVRIDNTTPTGSDAARLHLTPMTSGTIYYSMLVSFPSSTANNGAAGTFFAGLDNTYGGTYVTNAGLYVRQASAGGGDPSQLQLGIATAGGLNQVYNTTTPIPVNTPVLVVGSFTFGGVNTLDIFVNPTAIPFAEPVTHSATTSGSNAGTVTTLNNFFLRGNANSPSAIAVDELRMGTTFADVASHVVYWDIDGTTPGAGGATPSGSWDGVATNFNSDATGGAGGSVVSTTGAFDTVDFSAAADATGSYTVNVSGTRGANRINVGEGNLTLDGGTLAARQIDVSSGATATVTSSLAGSGTLKRFFKSGAGTLTLSGANTQTGTAITGGTLIAAHEDAFGTGNAGLSASTTVRLQAGLPKAVSLSSLSIPGGATPTATLDLTDNALVIRNADATTHTSVNDQVKFAFNTFAWDQPGITSTTVANDIANGIPKTLGILFNNAGGSPLFYGDGGDLPLFQGRSVDQNTVLVKYTLLGDGDLNGTVDSVDFALFQAGFDNSAPYIGFAFGDYNYDGFVDSVDFGLFQAGFDASQPLTQPTLAAAIAEFASANGLTLGAAAVPEPASLSLVCGAFGLALARRRRK